MEEPGDDSRADRADAPLVDVEGVHIHFGKLVAVRDVTFNLRGGDLLGLIGPNGAGKTTLLRSLAALQPIHVGTIRVLGEVLRPEAHDALRHVGFTPDTPPAYEDLTVRDYLRFIGKGYGLSDAETSERLDFWLEKVWLTEKAGTKIKGLSRGMRQRIGIARTLLPNPSVVLLDEPAAGLDPAGRVQFRQLLVSLREQGKALIVSSHILSDMDEYCTHIGIMSGGRMVQFGTVGEVAAHAGDGRCRYTVRLARPTGGADAVLESIAGITGVTTDDDQKLQFEFSSAPADAADLLAQLIARRLPVASFAPNAVGLEEAYLRTGIRQVD